MGLLGSKFAALSNGLKDSLADAKSKATALAERVEFPEALVDLSEAASRKARDYAAAGKEQMGKLASEVGDKLGDIDYHSLTRRDT